LKKVSPTDVVRRLARWSRRPLKDKAASLARRVHLLTDAEARLGRGLQALKAKDPVGFRRLLFGLLAPEQEYTVATDGEEAFVVMTSDQVISRLLYTDGNVFLPRLYRVLQLLGPGFQLETLIDVGANIGIVCIPAVKRGLARKAIAIEPEPRNFRLLQANLHLNGVADRIAAHHLALGAEWEGLLRFELSPDNSGDHRVSVSTEKGLYAELDRRTILVPARRLDDVVPDVDPRTSLLWMEAQGYEAPILRGAARAVQRRVPVLVEFCPYLLQRTGGLEGLRDVIGSYQRLFDVSRPEAGALPATAATLDSLRARLGEAGAYTDVLFC
jgi:FkbM family methyltransferase